MKTISSSRFDSTSVNNVPVKSFPVKIAQKESNNLVLQIWIINSDHGHVMEREREREKPFGNLTLHAVKFFAEKLGSLGGAFTGVVPALSLVKRRK